MKRISVWLFSAVAALWAAITFFASNSPEDVQQRASGWLALPLLKSLPDKIIEFAARPAVLALSFFALGLLAGWGIRTWLLNRENADSWSHLGTEMSLLAYDIEDGSSDVHRLNADIEVISVKAEARGIPFPKVSNGFKSADSILRYLKRVSSQLKAGNVDYAKKVARQMAASPDA